MFLGTGIGINRQSQVLEKPFDPIDIGNLAMRYKGDSMVMSDGSAFFNSNDKDYLFATYDSTWAATSSFEVTGVFSINKTNEYQPIVGQYNPSNASKPWVVRVNPSNQVEFVTYTASKGWVYATSTVTLNLYQQYHFVAQYVSSSKTMILRIDNTNIAQGTRLDTIPSCTDNITFGQQGNLSTYAFNGTLDSVGFTKVISSPAIITALYNNGNYRTYADLTTENGLGVYKTNLQHWYDMNEASGIRYDRKGTSNLSPGGSSAMVISNWDFETLGAGGADVFANWTENISGTSTISAETVTPYAGLRSLKMSVDASNSSVYVSQPILTVGKTYNVSFRAKTSNGTATIKCGSLNAPSVSVTPTTSWGLFSGTFVAGHTSFYMGRNSAASADLYVDNIQLACTTGPTSTYGNPSGAALDGDLVSSWTDDISMSTFGQISLAKRCKYKTNAIGGRPGLLFDGINDSSLINNQPDFIGPDNVTMFFVIKPLGFGAGGAGMILTNGKFIVRYSSSSRIVVYSDAVTYAVSANDSVAIGSSYVVAVTRSSTGLANIFINGTISGAANQATGTTSYGGSVYVGNSSAGTATWNGYIGDIMLYAPVVLGTPDIVTVSNYLKGKYGII